MNEQDTLVYQVLSVANEAYGSESRINEDLHYWERGDTLANFVHLKISDVLIGTKTKREALEAARHAMLEAAGQLNRVADALFDELCFRPTEVSQRATGERHE